MRALLLIFFLSHFTPVKSQIGSSRMGSYGSQDIYSVHIIEPELYGLWREINEIYSASTVILFDTNRIVVYDYNFESKRSFATEYLTYLRKGDCYFVPHNSNYVYIGTFSAGRLVTSYSKDNWVEFEKIPATQLAEHEKAIFHPENNYRIKTKDKTEYRIYDFYECHCDEPVYDPKSDTSAADYNPIVTEDDQILIGGRKMPKDFEKEPYLDLLTLEIVVSKKPFPWPEQEKICPEKVAKDGTIEYGPCIDQKPQLKLSNGSKDTLYLPIPLSGSLCSAEMILIKDNGDTLKYYHGHLDFLGSRKVRYLELLPGNSITLETGFCFEENFTPEDENGWSKPVPIHEEKKTAVTGVLKATFTIVPKMGYGPKEKYWHGTVTAEQVEVKFK